MEGNCIIGQSGGPTAVINSSVLGLVQGAFNSFDIKKVYGVKHGIEGVLQGELFDFSLEEPEELQLLKYTPSSALGSCRYRLGDLSEDKESYTAIFDRFREYNIRYFFYIGGNDSMDTVNKLNQYAEKIQYPINIIGIPKTIDNDLVETDHSPGFGSAAKYIATNVMEIARDSAVYDRKNVHIVEVMGRDAGWLAGASALASTDYLQAPDLIYFPERVFSMETFLDDIKVVLKEKKNVVVVVAEGIKNQDGKYIKAAENSDHDVFGHEQMGGVSRLLAAYVEKEVCQRVKAIELSVIQRASIHYASEIDLEEAYKCGWDAVKYALTGNTGKMVSFDRISQSPYCCETKLVSASDVANKEKTVPMDWINANGNYVKKEFIEYIKPLIEGQVKLPIEYGLPKFTQMKMLI